MKRIALSALVSLVDSSFVRGVVPTQRYHYCRHSEDVTHEEVVLIGRPPRCATNLPRVIYIACPLHARRHVRYMCRYIRPLRVHVHVLGMQVRPSTDRMHMRPVQYMAIMAPQVQPCGGPLRAVPCTALPRSSQPQEGPRKSVSPRNVAELCEWPSQSSNPTWRSSS